MRRGKVQRVLGYARVSSKEQALGTSLGDQQAAIKAYAQSCGLSIAKMYVEAESAVQEKIELREQIGLLMSAVRSGDLVIVDKVDRWSRDPEFTYGSVRKILAAGANFYAVAERLDPSTSEGDTQMGFRILYAREEHKRIRERTIGTRNLVRAKGYYVEGRPPFGYRRSLPRGSKGLEKNILIIHEEEAELVRVMFRMSAAGRGLAAICQATGCDKKRVHGSLRSRHYLGEIKTADGWMCTPHIPPIVDADLWVRSNDALRNRRHGGPRPRSAPSRTDGWVLRDVACCSVCGERLSAAYGQTQDYLRCRKKACRQFVNVAFAEKMFEPLVLARLGELRDELSREPQVKAKVIDHSKKTEQLQRRRARLVDGFADGVLTQEDFRQAIAKVDQDALKLRAIIDAQPKALDPQRKHDALKSITTLVKAWKRADGISKRAIVRDLVVRAVVFKDKAPKVEWRTKEALLSEFSQ
jgi:site-specific DNA recombinase